MFIQVTHAGPAIRNRPEPQLKLLRFSSPSQLCDLSAGRFRTAGPRARGPACVWAVRHVGDIAGAVDLVRSLQVGWTLAREERGTAAPSKADESKLCSVIATCPA